MEQFINNFTFGEVSKTFAESQLAGTLKGLTNRSVARLINGTPNGNEGIEQRKGYKINSLFYIPEIPGASNSLGFVSFNIKFYDQEVQLFINDVFIFLSLPDINKYFTTYRFNKSFDITSIKDVGTDKRNLLFIASSRGIEVFRLKGEFADIKSGDSILEEQSTKGLTISDITSVQTNVYVFYETINYNNRIYPLDNRENSVYFDYGYYPSAPFPIPPTIDLSFPANAFSLNTGIYIEYDPRLHIGDSITMDISNGWETKTIIARLKDIINGIKYNTNGYTKIYPSTIPTPLKQEFARDIIFDIPKDYISVKLFTISYDIVNSNKEFLTYNTKIDKKTFVRGVERNTNIFEYSQYIKKIQSISIENRGMIVKIDPGKNSKQRNFRMYFNTDNRIYISYNNVIRASAVNDLTNFQLKDEDVTKGDVLTDTDPLNLSLQGVDNIMWVSKLKDRGIIIGTNVGIKLLNYGATSFRLGIVDITSIIPSDITPINCTINSIDGIAFANSTKDKILFLSSRSTFETPLFDLTQYINFFINDKIKKMISTPYRGGEMTLVLTENNNLYRLITGKEDNYGWTRDSFDIIKKFINKESFPITGKNKIWYLDNSTNLYYQYIKNQYIQKDFIETKVYDIFLYQNKLTIVVNINYDRDSEINVIASLDSEENVTPDFYYIEPDINDDFNTPDNIFINHNSKFFYYPSEIDISFFKAVVRPSKIHIKTHYNEYIGRKGNSKNYNRYMQDVTINADNVYGLDVGYELKSQDNKEFDRTFHYNARTFKRIDDNLDPLIINGNLKIPNSRQAEKIAIILDSDGVLPLTLYSISYNMNF